MSGRVIPHPYTAPEVDTLLAERRRLHFIGIGGSGMYPLVQILAGLGYTVTGSDVLSGDITGYELAMGIPVAIGPQCGENLGDAELAVYTAALLDDNPELLQARERGLPCLERSQVLGWVSRRFGRAVCVAGTHGKTTTTAMLTQLLFAAGRDPGAVVGGKLAAIGGYGRAGGGALGVIEACEFVDTFLQLSPAVAVVLNIDDDHLDYFGTVENLAASFRKFASTARELIVVYGEDARARGAVAGLPARTVTFGFDPADDYCAADPAEGQRAGWSFTLVAHGKALGRLSLRIPGRHNILNALACAACALELGVDAKDVAAGIEAFPGAARRFEFVGQCGGADVADDYAHHPTELAATLTAAKEMGYRRVFAVFQPFTYTRTKRLLPEFAAALAIADRVVLTPIMASREEDVYHISSEDLRALVPGAVLLPDFAAVNDYVRANTGAGDLVLTLGCGNIYHVAHDLVRE